MKLVLFLFVFQLGTYTVSDTNTKCSGTFDTEIKTNVKHKDFIELIKGISEVHIEKINSLEKDEFSSLVSKLNRLYTEAIKSDSNNELNNLVQELGYKDFVDYLLLFDKISQSYEKLTLDDQSRLKMGSTTTSQSSRPILVGVKYSKNLSFNLIGNENFSTCESEYGQCAETAIYNFFGQTAVCVGVAYAGGGIAGALCQVANEINLYTNLYSCNNAFTNCTLQEA